MGTAAIIATLIFGSVQCEGNIARNSDGTHTLTYAAECVVSLSDCRERAVVVTADGVERETLSCDAVSATFDTNDWEG